MPHLCAIIVALLVGVVSLASSHPSVCIVRPSGENADFRTIQDALYGCGKEGKRSIKLIIDGTFKEGQMSIPEYLTSVEITSYERNLDVAGGPTIIGAFVLTKSHELALSISHVQLDGADAHPAMFYQTEPGATVWFEQFFMLGCVLRGYTADAFMNFGTPRNDQDRPFYFAGNTIVGKSDTEGDFNEVDPALLGGAVPNLSKAMPFPWTLQRAAGYAHRDSEEKKEGL